MGIRAYYGLCDRCETPVTESYKPLKFNQNFFCSEDCFLDFLENFPEVAIEIMMENMKEFGVEEVSDCEIKSFLDLEREKSDYQEHWVDRQGEFLRV